MYTLRVQLAKWLLEWISFDVEMETGNQKQKVTNDSNECKFTSLFILKTTFKIGIKFLCKF